jgi:hypothetical protein
VHLVNGAPNDQPVDLSTKLGPKKLVELCKESKSVAVPLASGKFLQASNRACWKIGKQTRRVLRADRIRRGWGFSRRSEEFRYAYRLHGLKRATQGVDNEDIEVRVAALEQAAKRTFGRAAAWNWPARAHRWRTCRAASITDTRQLQSPSRSGGTIRKWRERG